MFKINGRTFWIRKFLIFRLFRTLPQSEREHVIRVLPKKNLQEMQKERQQRLEAQRK